MKIVLCIPFVASFCFGLWLIITSEKHFSKLLKEFFVSEARSDRNLPRNLEEAFQDEMRCATQIAHMHLSNTSYKYGTFITVISIIAIVLILFWRQ